MSILKIRKYGDSVLRKKCKPIKQITPEIKKLISDMFDTMYANSGVGLAASQVGVPLRLLIIDTKPAGKKQPLVLINPRIIRKSGKIYEVEGCLSFPGIATEIKRYKNVTVNAINEEGLPIIVEGKELLSRAIQHEIDHLEGIVFTKRMPLLKRFKIQYEIRKRKKQGMW
ncbi:MAG: peptide deformylase [Endomicrobiales bacterium]|nr:peptide deformylase [Endomicrobiales bacterium]